MFACNNNQQIRILFEIKGTCNIYRDDDILYRVEEGLVFWISDWGFRVQGVRFRFRVQCLGFSVQGLGFRVQVRVQGLGFRVQGLGFRVGFRVQASCMARVCVFATERLLPIHTYARTHTHIRHTYKAHIYGGEATVNTHTCTHAHTHAHTHIIHGLI